MRHVSRAHSISWFQDQYRTGKLELKPPFQRKPVWGQKERCSLIESILLDIPIPEVYIQVTQDEHGTEQFGVVDGQQRLRTILQFIGLETTDDQHGDENSNNFELDELAPQSVFKDKSFADITGMARKNFFIYEICVRYLYTDNITEVEEVFKRLNKFTMPLKAQELRNATYHGAFAKLSEALADDEYWAVHRIIAPAAIRRMADIEMMSDLLIGLLHGPQGGSAKIIDTYYEQYEQFQDEFPEQARIHRLFNRTQTTIENLFPEITDVPRWGNRADYYSLFVAVSSFLDNHILLDEDGLRDDLSKFATKVSAYVENKTAAVSAVVKQYAEAISKGSNDKARRVDRHEALTSVMDKFFQRKRPAGAPKPIKAAPAKASVKTAAPKKAAVKKSK